jgi:hypothetical protein
MSSIQRLADKRLKITITAKERTSVDMSGDVWDKLSDKDLSYYPSRVDGWDFIYDERYDVVYWATDYGFDMWRELREKGVVVLTPHENSKEHYEGYEWNEGRKWRKTGIKKKPVTKRKVK